MKEQIFLNHTDFYIHLRETQDIHSIFVHCFSLIRHNRDKHRLFIVQSPIGACIHKSQLKVPPHFHIPECCLVNSMLPDQTRAQIYKRQEPLKLLWPLGSPPIFGGVRVAHRFSFLCFVCLRHVSCVPNVASISGLSLSCVLCTQCRQYLWIVHS